MDVTFFVEIAKAFGTPVAVLIVMMLGVWRAGKWLGARATGVLNELVTPAVTKHLGLVDALTQALAAQTELARSTAEASRATAAKVDTIATTHAESFRALLDETRRISAGPCAECAARRMGSDENENGNGAGGTGGDEPPPSHCHGRRRRRR